MKAALLDALGDSDEQNRGMTLASLGEYGDELLLPRFRTALDDPSPHVRLGAAQALCCYNDPTDLPRLLNMLKDDTWMPQGRLYDAVAGALAWFSHWEARTTLTT